MSERPRPQSKVSLEDLLRLKRAERPEPEFWAKFEDQLRRKQLAAIVDKRPWWRRLSAASIARISIPVGATAVVAFTLVTVAERKQPAPGNQNVATVAISVPSQASVSSAETTHLTTVEANDSVVSSTRQADVPVSTNASEATVLAGASSLNRVSSESSNGIVAVQTAPEPSLAQVILGLEGTSEVGDARPQYQASEASLLSSLDIWGASRSDTGTSLQPGSTTTTVSSPRDDRRARLLASVDPQDHGDLVSGNPRVAKSRDRIANRLAEQSLYDSISRLGLNGDSVSIKF